MKPVEHTIKQQGAHPTILPQQVAQQVKLLSRFTTVRQTTESLAEPLSAEDCSLQSMPDTSPTKWHLAHTSWFFETFMLERFEPSFKPFDPSFKVLFNSYYNGVGDKHPRAERGLISRPDLAKVLDYRRDITERMLRLLSTTSNAELNKLSAIMTE